MADVIARIYSCKYPRAVYRLGGYRAACDSLTMIRADDMRMIHRAARICGDGCAAREITQICFCHLWCRFVCLFGGDDKNDDGQPMVRINYSENQYFRNS